MKFNVSAQYPEIFESRHSVRNIFGFPLPDYSQTVGQGDDMPDELQYLVSFGLKMRSQWYFYY